MHISARSHLVSGRLRLRLAVNCLLSLVLLALVAGCGSVADTREYAYVAAPEAALRDRVASVYSKTGIVHNGERVQVLERMQNKRFVRVRSPRNEEGWVQERYLTDQQTYDQFQKLAQQFKTAPAQAVVVTRGQVNLHALPGRKTEHLYQLNENEKVDLLQRQTADKNAPAPKREPKPVDPKDQKNQKDSKEIEEEPPTGEDQPEGKPGQPAVPEDWFLVRDSQKRVGWVLGRMLYVDVPIDIAQYAEGQRIVAFFVLDQVQDKKFPEYLVLLAEPKDGLPYDFDQIRVFTWNARRHRYETAYRERQLSGFLPVNMGQENFDKEGNLRTFTLHVKDDKGAQREQKYKFNPPIVRRVLGPGEQPPARAARHKHSR